MSVSNNAAVELKPCPFCGKAPTWVPTRFSASHVPAAIACLNEECFGPRTTAVEDDAVVQWNDRARAPEAVATIRELREILAHLVDDTTPSDGLASAKDRGRRLLSNGWAGDPAAIRPQAEASGDLQIIIDEMTAVATGDDDSAMPEWLSSNRATIDNWQSRLRLLASPPSSEGDCMRRARAIIAKEEEFAANDGSDIRTHAFRWARFGTAKQILGELPFDGPALSPNKPSPDDGMEGG